MQVNHNVVAVVLNDAAPQLTFSVLEGTVKGGLGNKSKEFLIPNAVSSVLTRGPNTTLSVPTPNLVVMDKFTDRNVNDSCDAEVPAAKRPCQEPPTHTASSKPVHSIDGELCDSQAQPHTPENGNCVASPPSTYTNSTCSKQLSREHRGPMLFSDYLQELHTRYISTKVLVTRCIHSLSAY